MGRGNFESLRVWQNARDLVNLVYDIMDDNKNYGFRDQIQRAAVSIMNNIAEGYESGTDAKYANFLNIAKGSCSEVRSMLYVCLDRKYCSKEIHLHSNKYFFGIYGNRQIGFRCSLVYGHCGGCYT